MEISYDNNWVVKYNGAAKKLIAEQNVTVNDLFSLMLKDKNYFKCEDMLHLTVNVFDVMSPDKPIQRKMVEYYEGNYVLDIF